MEKLEEGFDLKYLKKIAKQGDAKALNRIGDYYFDKCDYKKALYYFEEAFKKGNVDALCNLAYMYEHGYAVKQDYSIAKKYYEQAEKMGSENAFYCLGKLYMWGLGVEIDHKKALYYYEKALNFGIKESLINLGRIYILGEIELDYEKAEEHFEESIKENFFKEECMYYLNIMYYLQGSSKVDYKLLFENVISDVGDNYLKKIYGMIKNGSPIIAYDSISDLTLEELSNLSNNTIINIRNIRFIDRNPCSDFYTVSDLKEIIVKCNEILMDIDKSQSEADIFMQIYLKLGDMLEYDFYSLETKNIESVLRNMMVLINKNAICTGFAVVLKNLLDMVGIDCEILVSKLIGNYEIHVFNQVKIDGKWYYCDLAVDSNYVVLSCLKSEKEFKQCKEHQTSYQTKEHKSNQDYYGFPELAAKNYLKIFKKSILSTRDRVIRQFQKDQ